MDESVQKHLKPKLSPSSERLLAAADYIEVHGHCKGYYWGAGKTACALGALMETSEASQKMERDLAASRLAESVGDVPRWNDAPERTQAEVVAKLRAVALGL